MPQGKHSSIQTEMATVINASLRPKQIARAFSELRCTFGGRSIIPDVSIFTWAKIYRDENGEISNVFQSEPSWTIEILSPEQSQTKVTKNILHCLNNGTEMGWLIVGEASLQETPDERTVFVSQPRQQTLVFDTLTQQLPVPFFANDIKLTVEDIFNWLLN
jgi:Uma2 family endonuclease